MKVIVAGSRTVTSYRLVKRAIEASGFSITEVVSGEAYGVDSLGEQWAHEHRLPIKRFPAQWSTYGRSAGYRRNAEMAAYADAAVIVRRAASKGSTHMLNLAVEHGLKVYLVDLDERGEILNEGHR